MSKQWERRTKKKFYLITASLLVLILSGGIYAYTYITAVGTINVAEPTADIATVNAAPTQPDWGSVTDNLSENTTCGEVPTGDLFEITPNPAYTGDLLADVHLANVGSLIKAYQYLNMKVYVADSVSANETPNYQLLTLQNGQTTFSLLGLTATSGTWTETTQADFADSTLNQVDTTTSPGDVILATLADNVIDTFDDQSKIASSVNVTVSGGQVKLTVVAPSVAVDAVTTNSGAAASFTHSHTVSGENRLLVVSVQLDDGGADKNVSSITYAGQSLTQVANVVHSSGTPRVVVYRLVAPPTGTANVVVTISGGNSNKVAIGAISYTGVDQSTPIGGVTSATGISTTPSVSVTSETNDLVQDAVAQTGKNAPTVGAGQTQRWNLEIGGAGATDKYGAGSTEPGAASVTMSWTYSESKEWVIVGFNINRFAYYLSGTVTSTNLLSGETVKSIDSFYYDASAIPSGTSLKVQFSTDNTTWYNSAGTPGGWDTLSQGTDNISLAGLGWSGANFYYHMEFTSDGSDTPVLDEIRVYFSTYYSSGDLTSSTFDAGSDLAWNWQNITFTIDEPSATDIKFQLRSAATEGGLSLATWYGPTGTGDYYTTSGTAINSVHDGDRWIQYKAYFSGPGVSTPTLSDVSITYTAPTESYTVEIIGGGYCLISDNTSEWGEGWATTPEFYCAVTQR